MLSRALHIQQRLRSYLAYIMTPLVADPFKLCHALESDFIVTKTRAFYVGVVVLECKQDVIKAISTVKHDKC